MSKATKRKHVAKEVLDDFVLPSENQEIVRVVASRGNNLHEVESCQGDKYLVSMPTKFRKNVWIKRGNFVIVESIDEGDKVKAEIVSILYKDQIKYIQEEKKWPAEFEDSRKGKSESLIPEDMLPPSDEDSGNEDLGDMISNPNRRVPVIEEEEDSSEESEEECSNVQ